MKHKIFIGINGSGKTEKLKNIAELNENFSLFLKAENSIINEKDKINEETLGIKEFKDFLDKMLNINKIVNKDAFNDNFKEEIDNEINVRKDILGETKNIIKNLMNDENIKNIFSIGSKNKPINWDELIKVKKDKEYNINLSINYFTFNTSHLNNLEKQYGTGKLQFFKLKLIYEILKELNLKNKNDYYLLLDEPETYLHLSLIRNISNLLRDLKKYVNIYISTHSPDLANYFYSDDDTEIFVKNNDDPKKEFEEIILSDYSKYGGRTRLDTFRMFFSNKIIICEGENDYKLLEYFLYKKKVSKNVYIKSVWGKKNIVTVTKNILTHYKDIYNDNDLFIVFDIDNNNNNNASINHAKVNQEIFHLKTEYSKLNIKSFNPNIEIELKIKSKKFFNPFDEKNYVYKNFDKIETKILNWLE